MTQSLFDEAGRKAILDRIASLRPDAPRQWGKMDVAQMLAHCSCGFQNVTGPAPGKQNFLGKVFGGWAKKTALGEKPFGRNLPTDPSYRIADARDLVREKERIGALMAAYVAAGPDEAARRLHPFFGRMTGAEWDLLIWKHLDHHLRQFGA